MHSLGELLQVTDNSTRKEDRYLEAVVGPGAELHDARLLVEGEVFYVDLAGRLVYRRWLPLDPPCVIQRRLRRQRHLEITVGAVSGAPRKQREQKTGAA